jgi:hypothetical protein
MKDYKLTINILLKKGIFFLLIAAILTVLVREKINFDYDFLALSGSVPGFFSFLAVFYIFSFKVGGGKKFIVLNTVYFVYMIQEFLSIFGFIGIYSLSDVLYYTLAYIYIHFFEL